ncbi:hypothetical protein K503DRAFT_680926 [Rhizopogon vinicolor AM-OR11-026]|uniref:rRNA-processing protein FYV7 n=1 Tax=Rhizopogon vinicolor AM-OR11-026 TaxID=1314800 RepID=A0A1B7NFI0_9AGAM|nr:hypothetical protein K503DRAFT_680926 [Rhizopogon vinicolor AM-OR11-026]
MVVEGTKHKKPPTFGHLPVNRARKLKKSWVESKKIKSQWKAQKKREDLLQRRGEALSDGDAPPAHNKKRSSVDEEKSHTPQASPSNTSADGRISLRDLTRQAYSRDSLHTYKANPKRHDTKPSRGGNSQRGSAGGGRSTSFGDRDREKGQPNMKFRMTAMLEKIKRDFT